MEFPSIKILPVYELVPSKPTLIELDTLLAAKRIELQYCPDVSSALVPFSDIFAERDMISVNPPITKPSLSLTVAAKYAFPSICIFPEVEEIIVFAVDDEPVITAPNR